jgi:hypothetical protein
MKVAVIGAGPILALGNAQLKKLVLHIFSRIIQMSRLTIKQAKIKIIMKKTVLSVRRVFESMTSSAV